MESAPDDRHRRARPQTAAPRRRGMLVGVGLHHLPYSSCRRHQTPCSFRPSGARSSHWSRAPQDVESARKGRVRVIDLAAVEHERAHAGPLARMNVGASVPTRLRASLRRLQLHCAFRTGSGSLFRRRLRVDSCTRCRPRAAALGVSDAEVGVEVAAERRRPGERPPDRCFVSLQLRAAAPATPRSNVTS